MAERWVKHGGWWRFWAAVYNPWPDEFCLSVHTCNRTLMFEVPGATISFYFGRKIDE